MPISSLQPLVTARFQEVNALLSTVAQLESADYRIPDPENVRALRGLLYVHMYGAFEFAIDQSFIRLAQHVSSKNIAGMHICTPIFSAALDDKLKPLETVKAPKPKFHKRIEVFTCVRDQLPITIKDNILSPNFQSAEPAMIKLAFEVYGISEPHLFDPTARGYIEEVVERRHAVAHGRESPAEVGIRRVTELRLRYDALYNQSMYVIDVLNEFCATKKFILPRHRRNYA